MTGAVIPAGQNDRRWLYRIVDWGVAHDGTHRDTTIVEVWHVGDRPVVFRGDAIEMRGAGGPDASAEQVLASLNAKIARCAQAVELPVLKLDEIQREDPSDWPSIDEQLND